jgi:signal transduction histidine kinase
MAKWRSSAAYRIAFTYSAAFAVAILLLGVTVYFAADAEFRRQRDRAIVEEATALAREPVLDELKVEIEARERTNLHEAYGLFDRDGRRIAGTLAMPHPEPGFGAVVLPNARERETARAYTVALPEGRRLAVALDSEGIEKVDATILVLFGGAFLAILLAAGLGALLLGHYLRRRLERIGVTAQAIIAGDFGKRVPIGRAGDEFDRVGEALNAMLDRIANLMENLRQVSSDVAHDLRTPLVRLRNQLELVGSDPAAAVKAIEQGDQLLALFGSILRIAEVEGGALANSFVAVDLSALATEVCEDYQPAIADSGRMLGCAIAPGIAVLGNRELLAQALGNLIDNARIHTPPATSIRLILDADADIARLAVADDGLGVAVPDRERILLRFVRGETSRTTPGAGLGLSLVAAVAAVHGGEARVSDNAPGLRITLTLPRFVG